jgi:hypothetical protein
MQTDLFTLPFNLVSLVTRDGELDLKEHLEAQDALNNQTRLENMTNENIPRQICRGNPN